MAALIAKTQNELENILKTYIQRIHPVFGDKLKKVVLFGSYARGDYNAESDVDIMVMLDEDEQNIGKYREMIIDIHVEVNLQYDVLLSVILQDIKKYFQYLDVLPFYSNVNKEGIVLYEQ